jgi:hypothetical protein
VVVIVPIAGALSSINDTTPCASNASKALQAASVGQTKKTLADNR